MQETRYLHTYIVIIIVIIIIIIIIITATSIYRPSEFNEYETHCKYPSNQLWHEYNPISRRRLAPNGGFVPTLTTFGSVLVFPKLTVRTFDFDYSWVRSATPKYKNDYIIFSTFSALLALVLTLVIFLAPKGELIISHFYTLLFNMNMIYQVHYFVDTFIPSMHFSYLSFFSINII